MLVERTSVGLDVHARSVAAAAIDGVTDELKRARLTPSRDHVRSWLGELAGPLQELPRRLTRAQLVGGFGLRAALPLSTGIKQS